MRCGLLPPDAAAAAPLASKLVAPTRLVSPNMATQLYGAPRAKHFRSLSRKSDSCAQPFCGVATHLRTPIAPPHNHIVAAGSLEIGPRRPQRLWWGSLRA
jgi:hypothetical protein